MLRPKSDAGTQEAFQIGLRLLDSLSNVTFSRYSELLSLTIFFEASATRESLK